MISQLHEPQHCLSRNLNTRVTLDLIDDLLGWPYGLLIAQSAFYCCSYELELFESSKFRLPLADKERLWPLQIPHQITYQLLLDIELDSQLIVRELPSSSSLHDAQSLSARKRTESAPLTSHIDWNYYYNFNQLKMADETFRNACITKWKLIPINSNFKCK